MNNKLILSVLFLSLCLAACNNGTNSTDPVKQANAANKKTNPGDYFDTKFMTAAASDGMMEVQAGKIAVQKGISQEVKEYGQQMIKDHSAANDQLKILAAQKNITLPGALGSRDQQKIDTLNKVDAKDFDKMYIEMMVKDHSADIDKFQSEVDHPSDNDVMKWAQNTLPMLLRDLETAKTDRGIVGKE
jgi:putative membrane protein